MNKPSSRTLRILHLYAKEMNIYGDRGNVVALMQRLKWRGIAVSVIEAGIGDTISWHEIDLVFAGGGQDAGQLYVGLDLLKQKKEITAAVADGLPVLTICGTYQLFGRGFTTQKGKHIEGIGVFKAETVGSASRMVGNTLIETQWGQVVGFENHSGKTSLDIGQEAFGRVLIGNGNDGLSGLEGAITGNVLGTYLHGPLLPKNPRLTDYLLGISLARKYGMSDLVPLDDSQELAAFRSASKRPQ